MAILFDLDDTLLDDRGAQEAYLGDLHSNHRSEIQRTEPTSDWSGAGRSIDTSPVM